MARIFTVGMETTPVITEPSVTFEGPIAAGSGASAARETSVVRSGTASRKFDSGASNLTVYDRLQGFGALGRGIYARGFFLVPALPSANSYIARLVTSSGGNFNLIRLTTAGKIVLCDPAGTQIGSVSAATVAVDTWYRLEIYGKCDTGAVDETELRLDGTTVASAAGQAYQETAIDRCDWGWMAAPGASKLIYWDDLCVNDDQGADQNSWPGDGKIVYLDAITDNAVTGSWTAGAGATTSLFAAVDNDPPAGVASGSATNTSQIKNTNTADATGNYDALLESYTAAGIGAGDDITVVQAIIQHGSSSATAVSGAVEVVSNPAQGGEETFVIGRGAAVGTYPSNWTSKVNNGWGAAIYNPSVTLGTGPVLRIGRRGTEAAEAHVCGMRLAVEYVPGEAAVTDEAPLRVGRSPLIWRT